MRGRYTANFLIIYWPWECCLGLHECLVLIIRTIKSFFMDGSWWLLLRLSQVSKPITCKYKAQVMPKWLQTAMVSFLSLVTIGTLVMATILYFGIQTTCNSLLEANKSCADVFKVATFYTNLQINGLVHIFKPRYTVVYLFVTSWWESMNFVSKQNRLIFFVWAKY